MKQSVFRCGNWIVTLSIIAAAAIYLTLVWLPGRRTIKAMQAQLGNKQQFIDQATDMPTALVAAQRELQENEAAVAQWENAAPRRKELPTLYGDINALAKDAGLAITRFDPQPFQTHEQIREIPLTIGCTGTFAQVFDFLREVESMPATIWSKLLRIEKIEGTRGDVQCELDLVIFSNNPQNSDYAGYIN